VLRRSCLVHLGGAGSSMRCLRGRPGASVVGARPRVAAGRVPFQLRSLVDACRLRGAACNINHSLIDMTHLLRIGRRRSPPPLPCAAPTADRQACLTALASRSWTLPKPLTLCQSLVPAATNAPNSTLTHS
jgi:hypothetical protein